MPANRRPLSLVSALVPGETPPDEAIVRAQLDLESLDAALAEPEDFERAGGSPRETERLWTLFVEVGGAVFRVAAEAVPALHSWHFEQPRWSQRADASAVPSQRADASAVPAQGERARAESARWAISVEGRLEDPPLGSLRDQLALALAAGGDECPALFDEASLRLWPASSVAKIVASKAGLGIHELASIHAVAPEGQRAWLHTHGLARAGVPELDALLVPRDAEDVVGELLNATASLLLAHGVPASGAAFPVGEGIEVALLSLDDALARIPPDAPGGRENRDEGHREPERLALAPADARRGGSPSLEGLVARARKGPFFRSFASTERMRVLARERWGEFVRLFHQHRNEPGFVFLVKLGYEPDRARERQEDLAREHLWFRVRAIEDDRIEAVLESSPLDIASQRKGDIKKHDLARLSEWLVITPAGRLRPDTPG